MSIEPQESEIEAKNSTGSWRLWVLGCLLLGLFFWPNIKEIYHQAVGTQFPESRIPWTGNVGEALQKSPELNKPVLLVFGASWCPPCKAMKRYVWPDEAVTQIVEEGFLPVYVDTDEPEEPEITKKYQVSSIPTVIVLAPDGEVLGREGSMSKTETQQFLSQFPSQ